jgi:hypothetical protein
MPTTPCELQRSATTSSGRFRTAGSSRMECRLRRIQAGACPEECCRPREAAAPLWVRCSGSSRMSHRSITRHESGGDPGADSISFFSTDLPAPLPGTPVRRRDGATCGGFRVRCSGSLPISRSRMRRSMRGCGSVSERATADRLPSVEEVIRIPGDSCTLAARSITGCLTRPGVCSSRRRERCSSCRSPQHTGAGRGTPGGANNCKKEVFGE